MPPKARKPKSQKRHPADVRLKIGLRGNVSTGFKLLDPFRGGLALNPMQTQQAQPQPSPPSPASGVRKKNPKIEVGV